MTTTSLAPVSFHGSRVHKVRELLTHYRICFGDEPRQVSANDSRIIAELFKIIWEIGHQTLADLKAADWRLSNDFAAYSEAWIRLGEYSKELESTVNLIELLMTDEESPRNEDTDARLKSALQLRFHSDLIFRILAGHKLQLDEIDLERYLKEYGEWPERDSVFDSLDDGISDNYSDDEQGIHGIDRAKVKANLNRAIPQYEGTLNELSGHIESMSGRPTFEDVPIGDERQAPSPCTDGAPAAEPAPVPMRTTSHKGLSGEQGEILQELATLKELEVLILVLAAEGPIQVRDLTSELKKHKWSREEKTISNNLTKLRGRGLVENRKGSKWETASKIVGLLKAGHWVPKYVELAKQRHQETVRPTHPVDVPASQVSTYGAP